MRLSFDPAGARAFSISPVVLRKDSICGLSHNSSWIKINLAPLPSNILLVEESSYYSKASPPFLSIENHSID